MDTTEDAAEDTRRTFQKTPLRPHREAQRRHSGGHRGVPEESGQAVEETTEDTLQDTLEDTPEDTHLRTHRRTLWSSPKCILVEDKPEGTTQKTA